MSGKYLGKRLKRNCENLCPIFVTYEVTQKIISNVGFKKYYFKYVDII